MSFGITSINNCRIFSFYDSNLLCSLTFSASFWLSAILATLVYALGIKFGPPVPAAAGHPRCRWALAVLLYRPPGAGVGVAPTVVAVHSFGTVDPAKLGSLVQAAPPAGGPPAPGVVVANPPELPRATLDAACHGGRVMLDTSTDAAVATNLPAELAAAAVTYRRFLTLPNSAQILHGMLDKRQDQAGHQPLAAHLVAGAADMQIDLWGLYCEVDCAQ